MRASWACSVAAALAALAAGCKVANLNYKQPDAKIDVMVDAATEAPEVHADSGSDAHAEASVDAVPDVPVGCQNNNDCRTDPGGPVCDKPNHVCVGCVTSGDCAGMDGGTPVCNTAAHACVGCLPTDAGDVCTGTKPICEPTTNACRACKKDSECTGGPGVCAADGHCATDQETVYVHKGSAACASPDPGNGSAAAPYCVTQEAVKDLTTKSIVVIRGSTAVGSLNITATTLSPASGPLLVVGQMGAVVLAGAGDAAGVHVAGSFDVTVRDLAIVGGQSTGVLAEAGAMIRLARCTINMNAGGGLLINGAGFDVTNTIIAANAATSTVGCGTWGGVCVKGTLPTGATSRFLNDTIVNNLGPGVACEAMQSIPAGVLGSIVSGNTSADSSICTAAACCGAGSPGFSTTTPYHLAAGSPCIDKLDPSASLPDDIDGDTRPQGPKSDCGADEYVAP